MIWVYAICDHPELPPPRRRGLAQAPLEGLAQGSLLAVVTRHAHAPAEPAPDALWVHERVVERLMVDRAVLPLRFGTRFAEPAALLAALAAREQELAAALERVRGRLEVGVRAVRRDAGNGAAPVARPGTGREYLLEKLAHSRRAERDASVLDEPLSALAVGTRRLATQAPDELLRAAYLVERSGVARFRSVVERLQREHPELALLCTGPWPPYSFVAE